jgi:hypothetical protein
MIHRALALSLAALAIALPAAAQEAKPPPAAKEAQPPPAAKEAAPKEAKGPSEDRPDWKAHVEAVQPFLKAWGKGKWEDAKAVAADKVEVKIGDKTYAIDVAGGKSDAKLVLPFRGLSSLREDGKMKGVAVNEMKVSAGGAEKSGKGKVMTDDSSGAVKVTSVEVE